VDLNELLKSAPQLQSIATTIVAGVPLAEIVKRIVLPSADALGERMKNRVERCFEKTAKMIEDAGVAPQPVCDKLVVEILRGASLEEDNNLHDMWAALLANAASPENADNVRPGFVATLKEMASDEASLLDWIYRRLDPSHSVVLPLKDMFADLPLLKADMRQLRVCLGGLESTGLITRVDPDRARSFVFRSENDESNFTTGFPFHVTPRGVEFVVACQPPRPKG
jgi:hypothetical protein